MLDDLVRGAGNRDQLPGQELGMVRRYVQDVYGFLDELSRIVKEGRTRVARGRRLMPKGSAYFECRHKHGSCGNVRAREDHATERSLPVSRRYLPTPDAGKSCTLAGRMRTETLLGFFL